MNIYIYLFHTIIKVDSNDKSSLPNNRFEQSSVYLKQKVNYIDLKKQGFLTRIH